MATEVTCVKKYIDAIEAQGRENILAGKEIAKGVAEVEAGISKQKHENIVAITEINKGVNEIIASIKHVRKEMDNFSDIFYYGYVKGK